jgi:hypothetical protein
LPGVEGGERDRQAEDFRADTIMADSHHYTFVQTHRVFNTKTDVNYGLRVVMMPRLGSPLWWGVATGEAVFMWEWADTGKVLYLPFDFFCELKLC